ncbi:MAG TPA: hypothetical protein PK228_16680 [Saprospiraceae bacterium]|nr:hypothetical protein [Saprospiraceae bacterium]
MPLTKDNYPNSLKNMTARVRNKAIEIANALLEEGRLEDSAIPIATSKAEEWAASRNIQVFKKERAAAKRSASPSSGKTSSQKSR